MARHPATAHSVVPFVIGGFTVAKGMNRQHWLLDPLESRILHGQKEGVVPNCLWRDAVPLRKV